MKVAGLVQSTVGWLVRVQATGSQAVLVRANTAFTSLLKLSRFSAAGSQLNCCLRSSQLLSCQKYKTVTLSVVGEATPLHCDVKGDVWSGWELPFKNSDSWFVFA